MGEPTDAPRDKAGLLSRIDRAWAALEESFAGLSEAQLTAPGPEGWSVKDHLAHIATWERILLVAHLQGRSFAEAAGMDDATAKATEEMTAETGLNDWFLQRDRGRPLADVLADVRETHARLLEALEDAEFAALRERMGHVIGNTYEHYDEHRAIIRALVQSG